MPQLTDDFAFEFVPRDVLVEEPPTEDTVDATTATTPEVAESEPESESESESEPESESEQEPEAESESEPSVVTAVLIGNVGRSDDDANDDKFYLKIMTRILTSVIVGVSILLHGIIVSTQTGGCGGNAYSGPNRYRSW
jgi:hypothetical protein